MGEFAANIGLSYQIGTARDNRSVLSAMDVSRDEFFANFGQSINDLILSHRKALERKRALETKRKTKSSKSEPKARWVDGTPEYSLHIYALRKLFPGALFIHIVRDVASVVRSMLNFHRLAGTHLVANEEEAYKYWLRMVRACLKAEQAYGPRVIYRLRYAALIDNPESAIRSLLDFVDEPYAAKCLEPLAQRINSSNVPADFKSDDSATDPAVVEEARRLSTEIEETAQPREGSPAMADEMEAAFQESYLKDRRLGQQLLDQERHYTAEIEVYKSQITRQERHYAAELEVYKSQIARQEGHYTAEIEQYKLQIARLRKQLWDTRKLSRLLDNVGDAAERLRNSRRWKLANAGAVIRAKLSHGKAPTGYGPLDKIVAAYSQWRASHPEVAKIEDEINALQFQTMPKTPATQREKMSERSDNVQVIEEIAAPDPR
jgi:hypothetical protein